MGPQLDITKVPTCPKGRELQLLGRDADAARATFADPLWGFTPAHAAGVCRDVQGSYRYDGEVGRRAALASASRVPNVPSIRFAPADAVESHSILPVILLQKDRSDLIRNIISFQYEMQTRDTEYNTLAQELPLHAAQAALPPHGDDYTFGTFATATLYQTALFTAGTGAAMMTAQWIARRIGALSRLYELLLRDDALRDFRARLPHCNGAPLVSQGATFETAASKTGAAALAVAGLIATLAAIGDSLIEDVAESGAREKDPAELVTPPVVSSLQPPLIYPDSWEKDLAWQPTDLRALSDQELQAVYDRMIDSYHDFGNSNAGILQRDAVYKSIAAERSLSAIDWEAVEDPELKARYEEATKGASKSLLQSAYEWPEAETWEPVSIAIGFGPMMAGGHLLFQHYLRHFSAMKNFNLYSEGLGKRARDEARRIIEDNLKPGGIWADCAETQPKMTQSTSIHDATDVQPESSVVMPDTRDTNAFVVWALSQSRDIFLESMLRWKNAIYQALQDELGDSAFLGFDTGVQGLGYALRQTFGGAVIDDAEITQFMTRLDKIHDATMHYYETGDRETLSELSTLMGDVVQLQNTSGQWTSADELRGAPYQIMGVGIVIGGVILAVEALPVAWAVFSEGGLVMAESAAFTGGLPMVSAEVLSAAAGGSMLTAEGGAAIATASTATGTTLQVFAGGAATTVVVLAPLAAAASENPSNRETTTTWRENGANREVPMCRSESDEFYGTSSVEESSESFDLLRDYILSPVQPSYLLSNALDYR